MRTDLLLATIHLPLWSVPAAVVVLCFAPDCARWLRKRRAGEARRLRALNELWSDDPRVVSPRPAATDAGTLGDAA